MNKKFTSLILALVLVLGLCAGITSISVVAKADTEKIWNMGLKIM